MKIHAISSWVEEFELSRPYTIAFRRIASVRNVLVRVETEDGCSGLGAASPEPFVTGESDAACAAALDAEGLSWLRGRDPSELSALCAELRERLPAAPAARAALDIALHDLWSKRLGVPLVEALGRAHRSLPTSITIGIQSVEETLEEAREYLGRGFRVLKVKLGHSLDLDLERLRRLRETVGAEVAIRVDANQGYDAAGFLRFAREAGPLDLEFVEQPLPVAAVEELRRLPEELRRWIAADEMLLGEEDALRLVRPPRPCAIFNIKLMKCGGVASARRIAAIAETAGMDLMWGCMDESAVSIAAGLHAALSSPATRYLDLDGSLDLGRDAVFGGFRLENGWMRTLDRPGLGVELCAPR